MRFISSLCWVKKGASCTPSKVTLEKNELNKLFTTKETNNNDNGQEEDAADDSIDQKYNLHNYDDEGELI